MRELTELSLIVDTIPSRDPELWLDNPPPERDSELGIGRHVAWQTPLHREAIRKHLRSKITMQLSEDFKAGIAYTKRG
jgi:hypothetical protein